MNWPKKGKALCILPIRSLLRYEDETGNEIRGYDYTVFDVSRLYDYTIEGVWIEAPGGLDSDFVETGIVNIVDETGISKVIALEDLKEHFRPFI